MRLLDFTVADEHRTVYCANIGMSWGYVCNDKVCEKRRYVGWDDADHVARGAITHLIWHLDGMPECKHCGSTLSGDAAQTGECRAGECPERDGGA